MVDYNREYAAVNIDSDYGDMVGLTNKDPSVAWIVLAIVGLGIDIGGAMRVFKAMKALKGADEVIDMSKSKKVLDDLEADQTITKRQKEVLADEILKADQISKKLAPDPNWKSTQMSDTGKNSRELRKNLGLEKGDGKEAHHNTASTSPHAEEARKILDKYQIDINSEHNGSGLSFEQHRKTGLHKGDNIKRVNDRIVESELGIKDWSTGREAVLEEQRILQKEILNGRFP